MTTQPAIRATVLLSALVLLAVVPTFNGRAEAQENEQMAAMMAAMQPGDQHRFLAKMEGEWTFSNTMWMEPGQPPMKSEGTAKKMMILGGRYLQEDATGEMMGDAFNGRGVTGYDNVSSEFVATWIDSAGTGIAVSRGTRDGDALTMHGEMVDPMSKQTMKVRAVTRVVDANRHVFEYFMTMPGAPEFKAMEIEYARKAAK